jgi:hypothetical protein
MAHAERTTTTPASLCYSCIHQQLVRNTRGSVFSLCRRSRDEPERFPRYPRLPVLKCPGYERESDSPADGGDQGHTVT